jgi:hypothetical protein
VDPIAILAVILPIVSVLTGSNTYVSADINMNWEEPLILFSLLVGKKGTKKTPILKALLEPLRAAFHQIGEMDFIYWEGTPEGLTTQLSKNDGRMLQVANEAESFMKKLYSIKGIILFFNI